MHAEEAIFSFIVSVQCAYVKNSEKHLFHLHMLHKLVNWYIPVAETIQEVKE